MVRVLNEAEKKAIDGLVAIVYDALGNENVDYAMYQAFVDGMKPVKVQAKANEEKNEKARREAEKELSAAVAGDLRKAIKVGDKVNYLLKSKGIVFENVAVEKITDKRFHVSIDADTSVIANGIKGVAGDLSDLKLGKKYINFESVQSVNGKSVKEFLEASDEASEDEAVSQ